MPHKSKITTGANDRPVDETVAQTGAGLPDDTSKQMDVDQRQVDETREVLEKGRKSRPGAESENPETVPEGTPGAGENICRQCEGAGLIKGMTCPDCRGTGKVITPVGGA
ncbi:hypothetical protein [Chelativorans salis]|uniref:Molecular chaperone DnaJ n=1 Tax=Chelativorans salis TaxID=2978478 RepID=A0ABT2LRS1_9HYPH|nr:hypothetical protein [Chelativorans sp. EGI FJ00035]MCT7377207.1 hypothetical protein [Chelativorans sp. EGI FJ00035]